MHEHNGIPMPLIYIGKSVTTYVNFLHDMSVV